MSTRLALFDLDGTLVDSAPDLADAVDRALGDAGRPAVGEAAVRGWIGEGASRLVHRALTATLDGDAEPALFEPVYAAFLAAYAERPYRRSRLYPGVVETLAALTADGWTLAVVTNKPARFTAAVLEQAGIADHFAVAVSGDSLPEKKPHAAPLCHAAQRCGAPLTHSAMIGDSLIDVAAARAAGVPAIAVDYGYAGGADLAGGGAAAVISSLAELPPVLARVLA